ncbi:hypothetical protein SBOR_4800 [Sclerotinia borealis F-4128]|uniref:Uncharacterized protein n=1 Tax=Sclerotinia borealis (strain F-4128) TaxID=1432307 RepID=W9CK12_SCLBF|nr:hypothetical protein SBOR_4800 [Sclerotinia borealis F-4128]
MNLDTSDTTETRRVAQNPISGNFDLLPPLIPAPQDFVGGDTMVPNKQDALLPAENDEDHYFRGLELIPGFPFWEFRGAPQNGNNGMDSNTTFYHTVTHSFLDLIKNAPPEIRTHIFAQIATKRVAEDDNVDPEGYIKKSAYFMQNYRLQTRISNLLPNASSPDDATDAQQKPECSDIPHIPSKNKHFKRNFKVMMSIICGQNKEKELGMSYLENDYPVPSARSYIDLVRFIATLVHSEGFYYEDNPSDWGPGIWKSEIRETSLLGEFLVWFWKYFVLDSTNDLEDCSSWLEVNHRQFYHLRNVSIDILASPYEGPARKRIKRSLDGRQFKRFLKGFDDLPNIEDLTVFVQIHVQDLKHLLQNPGSYGWANALRGVTFAKYFDVRLKVFDLVPKDYQRAPMSKAENIQLAIYRQRLWQLLMPEVLCSGTTDDIPDHLGLFEMFTMEED